MRQIGVPTLLRKIAKSPRSYFSFVNRGEGISSEVLLRSSVEKFHFSPSYLDILLSDEIRGSSSTGKLLSDSNNRK